MEKATYVKPELVVYGSLGRLTNSNSNKVGDITDGHNQQQNMHYSGTHTEG